MSELVFFCRNVMSGSIRAKQIAAHMGCRINPTEGYEDDICIFVKWTPAILSWKERYFDIVDKHQCLKWLKKNEDCHAIAISKSAQEYMGNELNNKIVMIPQQHVNFDREKRTRTEVKVVGFCGEYHTFQPFEDEIREKLAKIGMELNFYHQYKTRQNVIDFYKKIDIQIVWRVEPGYVKMLKNPLKLSNAGSFGIPTVSYPEVSFVGEYDGCFMPATTIDEMVGMIDDLRRDDKLYLEMSRLASDRAEMYHIDRIAELYGRLI